VFMLILFDTCFTLEIDHQYSLSHNTNARAISLGGAFTAVCDGPASMLYNPAAFGHYRYPQTKALNVYLNPVGLAASIRDYDNLSSSESKKGYHWASAAGLFVKSIMFSHQSLTIGLNLSESLPQNPFLQEDDGPFAMDGVLDWNYDAMTVCLKLADQVYIGAAGYYFKTFVQGGPIHKYGSAYGVFMNPSKKISAGLTYFDYPGNVANMMLQKNRTVDESINIGIVYRPFLPLQLTVDIRNVSEDTQANQTELLDNPGLKNSNEVHAGIELSLFSALALRSGFYRIENLKRNIYSFGIGLMDMNAFRSLDNKVSFNDFLVNYALEIEDDSKTQYYRHYLSLIVKL
jgi:hypothetical protein